MAAFFIVGVLKIDAMQYIPYAFVNWIVPIFSLTYGFTGFAIWKINKDAGNSPAESEASAAGDSLRECGLRRAPASATQPHSGHKRPRRSLPCGARLPRQREAVP